MATQFNRPALQRRTSEDGLKIQRMEGAEQKKHAQHESKVADAVDDERFLPRVRSRFFQEVKSDEQITREPHAFPTDEEQHVIRGQHQDQHEKHEQVEIRKKTAVSNLMRHVPGRVDVDQPAHSGHHQHHHHRELVHLQIEAGTEIARRDPREEFLVEQNLPGVDKLAHCFECKEKRQSRRADRHAVDNFIRPFRAKKSIHRRAQQRQQWNDPQVFEHRPCRHQSFRRSTRSTFSVCRLRAIKMIIPSPTAASAAATTITNNTKTCPSSLPSAWLNATNARLTAFSISSMDMKIVMMLRLNMNANTPSPNRIALSIT